MSPLRCHNKTVIDGLEWYCNDEKGHTGDHKYMVRDNSEYGVIISKRWKQ